jgi:hypothetical protein
MVKRRCRMFKTRYRIAGGTNSVCHGDHGGYTAILANLTILADDMYSAVRSVTAVVWPQSFYNSFGTHEVAKMLIN